MLFLDPDQPITTCTAEDCGSCGVRGKIHCHFTARDHIYFLIIALPSFLLGGAGIYNLSGWWLALWLLMIPGFFCLLEIRVLCSHCPHYAEPGTTLKCWANYGAPRLWKYRPGPMSLLEKATLLGGFALIWGYPLIFLLSGRQWFLLIVYVLTTAAFFMTLKFFLCTQCMNFACPLNGVNDDLRQEFFRQNPDVGRAWGDQAGEHHPDK